MAKIVGLLIFVIVLFGAWFVWENGLHKIKDERLIVITSPLRGAEISSPLRISGRAMGGWYFEGSFPIILKDQYGNVISEGNATAQGDWMKNVSVPFLGTLQFNNYIKGQSGVLVFRKNNPSGLPEQDDSVQVPVIFK